MDMQVKLQAQLRGNVARLGPYSSVDDLCAIVLISKELVGQRTRMLTMQYLCRYLVWKDCMLDWMVRIASSG